MKKLVLVMSLLLVVALVLGSFACAKPALTPTPTPTPTPKPTPGAADFYKSNTATMIVPFSPGGTIDYTGRLFATYWEKYAGSKMLVENRTGAGGIKGQNDIYNAKPDGLTFGISASPAVIAEVIFKSEGVQYDLNKMTWIGDMGDNPSTFAIAANAPFSTIDDLRKTELLLAFPTTTATTTNAYFAALILEALPAKNGKVVPGFAGSAEEQLSLGRGETSLYAQQAKVVKEALDKKVVKSPLCVIEDKESPWFPGVPSYKQVLKPSPELVPLFELVVGIGAAYVVFGPPAILADRVQFLRDMFDKISRDPEFVKQAMLKTPVWVEPTGGVALTARINKLMASYNPALVTKLQEIGKKYIR